jgi:hypothetical protein
MTLLHRVLQKLTVLTGRPAEAGGNAEDGPEETFHWTGTTVSPITPVQVRMGRAALGWGVRELAEKAGLTPGTITRFENGSDAKAGTIAAIRSALEAAGIAFIAEHGQGVGVKLLIPPRREGDAT